MQRETKLPDFIYIDDDPIGLKIFEIIAKKEIPHCNVLTFKNPREALAHISSTYSASGSNHALIFIDILMSPMSGWQVLDEIDQFPKELKARLQIFIFSFSDSESDMQKALNDPRVSEFIEKPMTAEKLRSIFLRYSQ